MAETILVVDDEAVNRELLLTILTQAGYEVEEAEGGAAALARAGEAPPDLILLDLMMPGMNGLEVCQRLKQDPRTAHVSVIVVTALGEVSAKEAAVSSGADDFVTKPVRAEDLRARVAAMLKVRSIRMELDRTLAYLQELEVARFAQRRVTLDRVVLATHPGPGEPGPGASILLVDDEALTRDFYGDLLIEHDFRVFAAASGPEALELASQHQFEAVVLDVLMPGMSGLEVLERLRIQDPTLPVIMLTGHATSQNAIAALKFGAFDFIVKGLDHALVAIAVHRAVRHRRTSLQHRQEVETLKARLAGLERALGEAGGGGRD